MENIRRFRYPMVRERLGADVRLLIQVCVRYCDASYGKEGEEVIQAVLPVLLDIGIIHVVSTVRTVSLQTVSQLVSRAGSLLKPSLVTLIPALLTTIGESENPNLSYLSNVCGTAVEARDAIDTIRANAAKGHYSTETITKVSLFNTSDSRKGYTLLILRVYFNTVHTAYRRRDFKGLNAKSNRINQI